MIVFRIHRDQGHDQANDTRHREHEGNAAVRACAEPTSNETHSRSRRHERDEEKLGDGTNHKRSQRRSRHLHALGKSEDPSLPFERDNFLDYGMFRRFNERNHADVTEFRFNMSHILSYQRVGKSWQICLFNMGTMSTLVSCR